MDSEESDQVRASDVTSEEVEREPSATSFLPSQGVGISSVDLLRGGEALWVIGPVAPRTPTAEIGDVYKWARVLESKKDNPDTLLNETKALLKHIGIPLDMGPYENWVLNLQDAKTVEAILRLLPEFDYLGDDYELSMRVANLLRLIAKSIGGRKGVWREFQSSFWEKASDIIERYQDNMFGRRNLAFLCLETGNWKDANKLLDRAMQDMRDEKALCGKAIALRHLGKKHDALNWLQEASKKNPNRPDIWRDIGDALLEVGRTQDAIESFKTAVKLRPTWGEVWEILGYAYEEAGEADESRECLARAANMLPSAERSEEWMIYQAALKSEGQEEAVDTEALSTERAEMEEERQRLEAERTELQSFRTEMEERERELALKYNQLKDRENEIALEDQEKDKVCNMLERVASLDKENILAFWRKGYTTLATYQAADEDELMEAGNTNRAAAKRIKNLLEMMTEDADRMPKDEYELMEEAMANLEEDKLEEALENLNTITKSNPDNEDAWFNKAEIFATLGKTKESLNSYERALELNPKNQRAWMERANLLMQEGFPVEAIRSLRRFLELDPKNAQYLRERAESYSYAGDFGNAILCYNSILQVQAEDVDALIGLGDAMLHLSDVEEADKFFQKAIKLAPGDERAWCKRAHILNKKGRWGAAIQLYNRSIALKWNYTEPWLGKAEIHLRQGDYDVAADSYDRATKIDSSDPRSWYGKGLALEKKKEYKMAERCYRKALKLNDDFKDAEEGLSRVASQEEE